MSTKGTAPMTRKEMKARIEIIRQAYAQGRITGQELADAFLEALAKIMTGN